MLAGGSCTQTMTAVTAKTGGKSKHFRLSTIFFLFDSSILFQKGFQSCHLLQFHVQGFWTVFFMK